MTALADNYARRRPALTPSSRSASPSASPRRPRSTRARSSPSTRRATLVPASADASLHVGRLEEKIDNSAGAAGDLTGTRAAGLLLHQQRHHRRGERRGHQAPCYVVDDSTVARTSNGGARPAAGIVAGVDSFGVAVGRAAPANPTGPSTSYLAGADLSSTGQFLFVKLNGSSAIVLADTAGEAALGVLQNAPANRAVARVRVQGVSKVIAGGTIADGAILATTVTTARAKAAVVATCDASGASATAAITGSYAMGRALGDGTSGNAMLMLVQPRGSSRHRGVIRGPHPHATET